MNHQWNRHFLLRPITVVFSKFQRYFIAFAKFQQNKILYNHFWALTKTESKPSLVKKSTSDPAPRTYVWVKKIIISLHKNNNVSFLLSFLRFVFRARRVSLFVYYLKINKNKGSPPPSLFIWFSIFFNSAHGRFSRYVGQRESYVLF